ncbi:MAG: hypothetical protein WA740_01370, partial [Candidatus Binataceae bacterium]
MLYPMADRLFTQKEKDGLCLKMQTVRSKLDGLNDVGAVAAVGKLCRVLLATIHPSCSEVIAKPAAAFSVAPRKIRNLNFELWIHSLLRPPAG